MLSNERAIVVGVDGSPRARLAVKWAADEARLRDVVLRVVCAATPHPRSAPTSFSFDVFHISEPWALVEDAVGLVATRHPDVMARGEVLEAPAAEALVETAELAEMLVVGARGSGGLAGLHLGSVSRHCVHHARGPLVVVHAEPVDPSTLAANRRIVVGIDGSLGSDGALGWALDEAERREAEVTALHAWQFPPVGGFIPAPAVGYETEADQVIEAARTNAARWRPGVHLNVESHVGVAVPALVERSRRADLLVVGRRGRGRLRTALLGSTASQCADDATCPVVIVPTADVPATSAEPART
jgi:nucleotide-binding universal stress UspA family protein